MTPTGGTCRRWKTRLLLVVCLLGWVGSATGRPVAPPDTTTQWAFDDAPLRDVLSAIEARTELRFLYRDALIAGRTVSLRTSGDVLSALRTALQQHNLRLQVDAGRQQAIITPRPPGTAPAPPPLLLTGIVLDAAHGTPLPLATLSWTTAGRVRGVAADKEGHFRIPLKDALARRDTLQLRVSYVGYAAQTLHLPLRPPPSDLAVRLQQATATGPSVVVQSEALASDVDTTWRALMRPSLHAALGEPSVLRALQPLPSIAITPTLAAGTVVRGSPADGFDVRLDGMTLFNQTHLFGLFDAFNDDVLDTVGFYYGVPPVRYPGPPGGTIAFRTRTGSATTTQAHAGLSNTAAELTLEGPLADGRASWLLSARRSYFDAVRWMNTTQLLVQGLGVDPKSSAPSTGRPLNLTELRPTDPDAMFYDVHGSLVVRGRSGTRLSVSAYAGGDATQQSAERLFITPADGRFDNQLRLLPVSTDSDWGNEAASVTLHLPMTTTRSSRHTLAVSRYHAMLQRAGFATGAIRVANPGALQREGIVDNELWLGTWTQVVESTSSSGRSSWTAGYALAGYDLTYTERIVDVTGYTQRRQAAQGDAFAEVDRTWTPWLRTRAGLRTHVFSRGPFTRLSPRLHVTSTPHPALSFGLGYSRTHQFVHRLSREGESTIDVWVMSSERQPPHTADHVTARGTARLSEAVTLRVEGYWKEQRDVRLHRSEVLGIAGVPSRTQDGRPFLNQNTLRARGLETMVRVDAGGIQWTGSHTLSSVRLRRTTSNGAAIDVYAPWDRRHQAALRMTAPITDHVTAVATGLYASGEPDMLDVFASNGADTGVRLRPYHRLDAGVQVQGDWGGSRWTLRVMVQNLYDRDNPWYRDAVPVVVPTDNQVRPQFSTAVRSVYDLGVQPSFSLEASW